MSSPKTQPTPRGQEPPMYLQRPSSGRSQDVRHILARTFRDLYTRDTVRPDTVKNLQVSKGGDDPYHERYVDNLQKVYTEWQRRMDEAAMLERHIMQAQARAMSADERELNKASLSCENYTTLGLPPVRAHFKSCIDSQLLRQHNLLTPSDYMVQEAPPVPAPQGPKLPDYARDTLASRGHSRQQAEKPRFQPEVPQAWLPGESAEFPTYISDIELPEKTALPPLTDVEKQVEFPKRNAWKEYMSEDQREAERKDLEMVQSKINFLRNPRYIPPSATPGGRSLVKASKKTPKEIGIHKEPDPLPTNSIVFVPSPPVVEFKNYKVGDVYEITLELKNMSTVMRQCRVLPPSSNIFSIGLGQFPGESGLVAPGMSCKYDVRFAPESLKDYDDHITVQTQASQPILVPLRARRPPPILTLPSEVDLGSCLVGGIQATQLLVKNEGGPGRFCLMTRNKWPTTSIRTVIPNITKITIKQPPFEIHPATFELGPGQSTVLEVLFHPQSEKIFTQEMTICCDNCHATNFRLKGQGEIAEVGIAEVEMGLSQHKPGEIKDFSAQNLLRFDDLNPFTYTERLVKVVNDTKVELPFQWMVYKCIMSKAGPCELAVSTVEHSQLQYTEERVQDVEAAFSVFPNSGVLQPSETAQFRFTFAPPQEGEYHNAIHMVLKHIPPAIESSSMGSLLSRSVDSFRGSSIHELGGHTESEESHNVLPPGALQFKDLTGLEVEVKGKCIPLSVVLHPYAIFMHAPLLLGSTVKRLFTMANHSYSTITFQWEPYTESYMLEVEPPFGELDPGMAMDLEISITGVEPGTINHTLLCYVMNMAEPLHLHIQATIKGPELRLAQPSIDFGLVRVGQQEEKELTVINTSQILVKFNISDTPGLLETDDPMAPSDMIFSERSGELKPLERRNITVTFAPTIPRTMKRVCQVEYEGGEPCSIGVYGEAQNPVVCFLECDKFLPEVYLDVPVVFKAVLHNQTLLPTQFKWGQVEGSQKDDCSVEIQEPEGSIQSWEQKAVSIAFTPHKPMSYSEVRLPCSIEGQSEDIYLNISCDVRTLEVLYKTSTDTHLLSDNKKVDFGDEVPLGKMVKRYVHICNQTAITAPFNVDLDTFAANLPVPPPDTAGGTARSRGRNLLSRTPNIADPMSKTPTKAMEEYNKFVLSEQQGVAFVASPASGQLQPFGESIIEVVAHSDMWGTYKDNLIFKVGYLETVLIPLTMTVVGCPLNFQLTAGHTEHKPVVRFGSHVSGADAITRKLKINNTSPKDIRLDWEVFNDAPDSEKLVDFITCFGRAFPPRDQMGNEILPQENSNNVLVIPPSMDTISNSPDTQPSNSLYSSAVHSRGDTSVTSEENPKIISCFLRPHLGDLSSKPFSIKPTQLTVPGKGSNTVELTFTPLPTSDVTEELDCVGFGLGYLSLDKEDQDATKVTRCEAYATDLLRLDFTAHLKPALLTIEETDDEGMIYRSAMSDVMHDTLIKPEALRVCSTMLSNNTLTPLTFSLKVKDPWVLVNLDPATTKEGTSRALETMPCTLNPRYNLMVKVAFRVTPSLVTYRASSCGNSKHNSPRPSTPTVEEIYGRKLNYQDQLVIQFDNHAEQTVPLYASLAIPQFELSADILDFGTCLVGQTREQEVTITNMTASHSFWTISLENKSDYCDDNTFLIEPREGKLEAHITHVSNSKAILKVFFTAGHSEAYDCTFLVQGLLGEDVRRLHVTGNGSYDGKHEAILNI